MAQIHHDTQTIHLSNDLAPKSAHALMRADATGRVTDVVIAIVTQRHIDDATLGKMLQTFQLSIESKPILNAKHDAMATLLFIRIEVGRGTSYPD